MIMPYKGIELPPLIKIPPLNRLSPHTTVPMLEYTAFPTNNTLFSRGFYYAGWTICQGGQLQPMRFEHSGITLVLHLTGFRLCCNTLLRLPWGRNIKYKIYLLMLAQYFLLFFTLLLLIQRYTCFGNIFPCSWFWFFLRA